uniref:Reverse transcriptase domain-containing protein n=1 Tax=Glossina austeni TaxID=7395 RepID=A0A1A9UDN4_GLOAU
MQNLMRHTEYTLQQKINRIYRNSRREYQLFIGQTECVNLSDMISLAEHYEDIPQEQTQAGHHRTNGAMEPKSHSLPYDGIRRRNVCHRCAQEGHYAQHCQNPRILFCWECGRKGILTKDCCRVNGQIRPQFRGMGTEDNPDTYERTIVRPESPELRIEKSSVIANVTVGGLSIKGVIDTGATRTNIKCNLQDPIPFVSEAPNISTKIRMADGTLRLSHRELVTTVRIGEAHFQLPLLVLDDVVDDLTLGMDFLIKAQAILVIGERAIQIGSPVKRPKDPCADKSFDTISNSTYGVARGPASISVVEAKHDNFIGQAPTKRRDNALPTRVDPPKEQRIKRIHQTSRDDKFKGNEPAEKFSHSSSPIISNTRPTNMTLCPDRNVDAPSGSAPDIGKFLRTEFAAFDSMRGITSHQIRMKDDMPIKIRYHRKNPAMQEIINREVDQLLKNGHIEPSNSPYSAPVVLVPKRSGEWRLCIDYRILNRTSIPDAYPLPKIEHILDKLREAKCISTIDLKHGYWQIPMDPHSKQYTAFTVPGRGLYQWRVMPFGLHSAPATFQRALDRVIGPELEPFAFAYLDDIIVISKTVQEHT